MSRDPQAVNRTIKTGDTLRNVDNHEQHVRGKFA